MEMQGEGMEMKELLQLLAARSIPYTKVDHPPVYTCEEAERLVPPIKGVATKNLFLRDGKGKNHFLLSIPANKAADLKSVAGTLGVSNLSLASPERLKQYLGLEPGSVTLLGVVNDGSAEVQVLIDEEFERAEFLLCHPLCNTSTLSIAREDLLRLFAITGHQPRFIPVADRLST